MADENIVIGIKAEVEGGKVIVRTLGDIDKAQMKAKNNNKELENQFKQTGSAATHLGTAIKGLAAAFGLRELQQIVDTYTNVQNRLKLVTNGAEELTNVTKELFKISNETRQSFASTAETYTRVSLATKELGISQEQTLQFSRSLNQAIVLSGASAMEAEAGMIQLSQGLASGTLRGDELRSVLEQLPAVADIIAKSLGVTRGELRKMGEEGKITADVIIKAFADAREELDEKFAKTVSTIGQSFVVLKNRVIELIGELDKSSGASEKIAFVILKSADVISMFIHEIAAAFQFANSIFTDIIGSILSIVTAAVKGIEHIVNAGIKGVNLFRKDKIAPVDFTAGITSEDIVTSQSELSAESRRNALQSLNKAGNDFGAIFGLNESADEPFVKPFKQPKPTRRPKDELNETNEVLVKTNKELSTANKELGDFKENTQENNEAMKRFASSSADAFSDFVSGVKTGKEALSDLVGSLQRMLIQETITDPLSSMLSGAFKGSGVSGGISSALSGVAGSLFGSIGSGIKSLFGFDSGGSMTLGGKGGIDQNILSLNGMPISRTSRGETLSISPGTGGGGAGVIVNQTINLSMGVAQAVAAEFSTYLPKIQEATRLAVNEAQARGIK